MLPVQTVITLTVWECIGVTMHHAGNTRPRARWGWWAAAVVIAAALGAAAWLAWDGYHAYQAAGRAQALAADAGSALESRDAQAMVTTVTDLAEAADDLTEHTSGPMWWLAARTPWVKDQVIPIQAAAAALHAVAAEALLPLAQADGLDALAAPDLSGGAIDPYLLEPYREDLANAQAVLEEQQAALAAVDTTNTREEIAAPLAQLSSQIDEMLPLLTTASLVAELFPELLAGEKTYIVAVQNNAEPRATGGIPGALVELHVTDGVIELGDYRAAGELVTYPDLVTELTESEANLFGDLLAQYPQNANLTPQFSRTAEILSAFWVEDGLPAPDGVISLDPVAIAGMLDDSAVIEVAGVEITSANAPEVLLRDSYELFPDPQDSDDFFAAAAGVLFQAALGGSSVVDGLLEGVESDRVSLWMAGADAQGVVEALGVAGNHATDGEELGVFLNDGSGSKIGYYIDRAYTLEYATCEATEATLTVTLTHAFDGDPDDLPDYVSGADNFVPTGEFHSQVLVYYPEGWTATAVAADGDPASTFQTLHDDRLVMRSWAALAPGETYQLTITFQLPAGSSPRLVATPGPAAIDETEVAHAAPGCAPDN